MKKIFVVAAVLACSVATTSATSCTAAADCSNHAVSVSGTTQSGCTCTCRNLWSGVKCDSCPAGVDAASDCGACSPGYAGYPACSRVCTVSTDCSNHAVGVSGMAPNCNCMCRNMWTGSSCDECPAKYGGPDCAQCAPGFGNYPACTKSGSTACTVAADCSNHAIGTSGTSPNCSCTCRNLWSGVKCDSCPAGVDAASDCGACSPGYAGYPACSKSSATTQPPQTPAPTRDTKPDGKHEHSHSPRAAAEDEEKESTAAKLTSFFSSPLGIAAAASVVVALLATIVAVFTLLKMKRVVKTQAALPTNFDVMDPAEKSSGVYRVMVNEL